MFLNGTLFNSEAWQGISSVEEEHLERVDEALLRGLLKAHSKIPIEALHLESGTISIRYILKNRRLCYLYTILKKEEEELVREIYDAQKSNPSEGDFCKLVEKDASDIGIKIIENEILTMKEERFKDNIKNKVRIAALKNLLKQKDSHSKMDNLSYKS